MYQRNIKISKKLRWLKVKIFFVEIILICAHFIVTSKLFLPMVTFILHHAVESLIYPATVDILTLNAIIANKTFLFFISYLSAAMNFSVLVRLLKVIELVLVFFLSSASASGNILNTRFEIANTSLVMFY